MSTNSNSSNNKMKKIKTTALERLAKLRDTEKLLIEKRNRELLELIDKHGGITIDDSLLVGFLIFISDKNNKDHAILTEFRELHKSRRSPSKAREQNQE